MSVLGYTVFSDDFNRADSGTVGNGWSENESAVILSNQLRLGSAATNTNAGVFRNLTNIAVVPYEIQTTLNISGGTRNHYFSPFFSTVAMNGLAFTANLSSTITIYDGAFGGGGTTLATGNFIFSSATKYWLWLDLTRNGTNYDLNVYISATSTKPGSPSLTATNFTPSQASGTYTYIQVDGNTNQTCDIDFVTILNSQPVILDSSNITTDSQSYAMSMSKADINVTTDSETLKYNFNDVTKSSSSWLTTPKS